MINQLPTLPPPRKATNMEQEVAVRETPCLKYITANTFSYANMFISIQLT